MKTLAILSRKGRGDVSVTEQLRHQIDVAAFRVDALCKGFPQAMCGEFAVQSRRLKRFLEHLVCGLPVYRDNSVLVSGWEERTGRCKRFVCLPVPVDQTRECLSAVGIHRRTRLWRLPRFLQWISRRAGRSQAFGFGRHRRPVG